ncbi:hypothetical protein [Haloglomus litoreum]|uniref:hypothetical protein n=1 Tax=Haloglomus litoreum TaxID=3034026 RepID=UPI0023E8AA01|nr:hypothetical protein [Haloglomus sp. DT116]
MVQPDVPNDLVQDFASQIEDQLKNEYDEYGPGTEEEFIDDVVDLLDNIWATDGTQYLIHSKSKELHQSPYISFYGINNFPRKYIELGDILVIVNFHLGNRVIHRQGFISQVKCIRNSDKGYATWEVDKTQFHFVKERPKFCLQFDPQAGPYDLSETTQTFLNCSFVSDVHRPFLYAPADMDEFMREMANEHRFNYGLNPPSPQRYLLTTLKRLIRRRYGTEYESASPEFDLIKDIYRYGNLGSSTTRNKITDGGQVSDDGAGFGIIELTVLDDDSLVYDADIQREASSVDPEERANIGFRVAELIGQKEYDGPTLY